MTADGIVAKHISHNADWTSKADKKAFIAETKKHGAIIMGETTYKTIGRPLPGRLNFILAQDPETYREKVIPNTLEFFSGAPRDVIQRLKSRGFESAILGGGPFTNSSFLQEGLVNEVLITVEPRLFGNGMTFAKGHDLDIPLELIRTEEIGDGAVHLHYKVLR